jgi:hypothetical protein
MLAVAQRRVERAGTAKVELVVADVETHAFDEPADVAISRFGEVCFAYQVAALANLREGLTPSEGSLAMRSHRNDPRRRSEGSRCRSAAVRGGGGGEVSVIATT